MNIMIATAIYPPEVGGPSFYAAALEDSLVKAGHAVRVVRYGRLKTLPTGLRHLLYALRALTAARKADTIIVLDTFSTAVPVGFVAPLVRAPIVCRVGGDFVWERYVERTHDPLPLPVFYAHRARWGVKERLSFRLIRFALRRMTVVFSSAWQRDIWTEPYGLDVRRARVIENAIPPRLAARAPARKNFMLYGRPLHLKNAEAFRRAFERAKLQSPDLTLEEGSVPRQELFERLRSGYAVVLPSISDVTPNTILESLMCGKPFLLTKYSAYAERFKQFGVIVDPLSEEDMAQGILALADPVRYERLCRNIAGFTAVRTYDDIAREFVALRGEL